MRPAILVIPTFGTYTDRYHGGVRMLTSRPQPSPQSNDGDDQDSHSYRDGWAS